MATFTVRNVPEEVHRGIRALAERHGRSAEAEIRAILARAILPQASVGLGSRLLAIGKKAQLSEQELAAFQRGAAAAPDSVDFE